MEEKNPLEGEKPNKDIEYSVPEKKIPQNPEDSKKEISQENIIKKKRKDSNKNNNKKSSELNININNSYEDELEHPNPLLSDYYEEGKDEIKNDFFKNKLKEREKEEKKPKLEKIVENNKKPVKNKVIKVKNTNDIKYPIEKEKSIEYKEILDNIAPPPVENIDLGQNFKNYYSNSLSENKIREKKEEIREIEREKIINLPQKKENIKSEQILIKQSLSNEIEINHSINKENIDICNAQDKCLTDIKIKSKLNNQINNSHQKINQIINKKPKNGEHLKNIAQKNYVNLKKQSRKIVRKPIKLNPFSKSSINDIIHEEINQNQKTISKPHNPPEKILKIKNIKENNIINKNYETYKLENKSIDGREINIGKSNPFVYQNSSQIFCSRNNIKKNKAKNRSRDYQVKKKKSQSLSSIPLKKRFYDTASKLNKIENMKLKENNFTKEKMMNSQHNFNIENSPMKNMQQSANDFKTFQKNKKFNKIPLPINHQKYSSSQINKKDLDVYQSNINNFDSNIKSKMNSSCSNINNENKKISNIHNNNNFYSRYDEQKENFQDNSQYQKQTYDKGGKYNNIQTTYVVISKNSNSKLKLIPKNVKTIEYENNRYLNTNQSEIYLKSSKGLPAEQIIPSSNTEKKVYLKKIDNINNYYSPYMEGQNTIPKTNSMIQRLIKIHKSQNDKKNYDSFNQSIEMNNYGLSYRTNASNASNKSSLEYSNLNNKAQTINFQKRNDYYLSNKPIGKRAKRFDDFYNFYDYEGNKVSTEPYGICSMNNNNYRY